MTREQAKDSVDALEQMWEFTLNAAESEMWIEALLPFESVVVATAILKHYERGQSPEIDELLVTVNEMEQEKHRVDQASPHVRTGPTPDADRAAAAAEFVIDLAPWIKGWAVARYRHGDFRVFPEQRSAYDSHQIANPGYRTYVWPDHEQVDPESAAAYITEGAPLKVDDIFGMMSR
jgi:hypothetical protein